MLKIVKERENIQFPNNVECMRSAARLERSSFFAAGNAVEKIAGVEGG